MAFLHPALLFGLAAAAIPIVIHLVTRPRPRRVRFPALGLLHAALRTGRRAQQVRNWALLAIRALVVLLLALLLAGPNWGSGTSAEAVPGAAARTVIIFDDSLSTRYQLSRDESLLSVLEDSVSRLASRSDGAPDPAVTVLRSSAAMHVERGEPGVQSMATSGLDVRTLQAEGNAAPLGVAFRTAARILSEAPESTRRLLIVTDLAAHAWRDVTAETLDIVPDVAVRVFGPIDEPRTNLGLTGLSGSERCVPTNATARLTATIWSSGITGPAEITATSTHGPALAFDAIPLTADHENPGPVALPSGARGAHAMTLGVAPEDRLAFDQRRHAVWQTAEPPHVWMIVDDSAVTDLSVVLLQNLLAPDGLSADEQLVRLAAIDTRQLAARSSAMDRTLEVAAAECRRPAVVVLFDDIAIEPATLERLLEWVEQGSTLLLLPDSQSERPDWPGVRRLLSGPPRIDVPRPPASLALQSASMEPEVAERNPAQTVRRRIVVDSLSPDAVVIDRYDDQVPAVIARRLGRGKIVLLTTSPDPAWSDLGRDAASLMTWCFELIDAASEKPDAIAEFQVDQRAAHVFSALPPNGLVRVEVETNPQTAVRWLRLANGAPPSGWPTEQPGIYRVETGRADETGALYAVNWPAAESDLTPISETRIAALLGKSDVRVEDVRTAGRAAQHRDGFWSRLFRDPTRIAAALLLLAFISESIWAGRNGRAGRS